MNRWFWPFLIFTFLPLICKADVVQITYGSSNLTINTGPAQEVKIDHRSVKKAIRLSFPVATAEAAVLPNAFKPENFRALFDKVQEARHLDDLRPVLSDKYFQSMQARVKAGVSRHMVLAMFQAMRPQKVYISDFSIEEGRAEFAVAGQSHLGPMRGLIRLVKSGGIWQIDRENWYAGGKDKKEPVDEAFRASTGVLSNLSPEYVINRNRLSLVKVPHNRRYRSIMFIFLMNSKDKDIPPADNPRGRMHVMVPGVKKVMTEQILIQNEYPIDVSVSKSEDGYAPDEWNLLLPNKKPREVDVSLLWSF